MMPMLLLSGDAGHKAGDAVTKTALTMLLLVMVLMARRLLSCSNDAALTLSSKRLPQI
jgi:hypothetical protein